MSQQLIEAVGLLADLVALSKPSAADVIRIETVVQGLMPDALDEVDAAVNQIALDAIAAADALVAQADAQIRHDQAEADRIAAEATADADDAAQRKRRLESGVS